MYDQLSPNSLYRDEDVALFLSIAPQTLRAWRCQGRGPAFVKLGERAVRYRGSDLIAYLDGLTRVEAVAA